ncbi:hypothetical protein [Litoreibacter arenae]|nr:hypothetical protein [Litoreibacter arenae]
MLKSLRHRACNPAPGLPVSLEEEGDHRPDEMCCTDITFVPVKNGFGCLVAVIDQVLRRRLPGSMDTHDCVKALKTLESLNA